MENEKSYVLGKVRSFDAFAQNIGLTLNYESSYKTLCGGITTIFIFLVLIAYSVILVLQPLEVDRTLNLDEASEQEIHYSTYEEYILNSDTSQTYQTGEDGFMVAFKLIERDIIPEGFEITFIVEIAEENTENSITTYDFYYADECTSDHFPEELQSEMKRLGVIGDYVCPSLFEWYYENNSQYNFVRKMDIYVFLCSLRSEANECIDPTAIASQDTFDTVSLIYTYGYIDSSDSDSPVKYAYDATHEFILDIEMHTEINFEIVYNIVHKLDGTNQTFYTPGEISQTFRHNDQYYLPTIYFMEISNKHIHHYQYQNVQLEHASEIRNLDGSSSTEKLMPTENSILFILAQIGGLYSFLKLVLGFFVSTMNFKSFEIDLLNQIYTKNKILRKETLKSNRSKTLKVSKVLPDQTSSNQAKSKIKNQSKLVTNEEEKGPNSTHHGAKPSQTGQNRLLNKINEPIQPKPQRFGEFDSDEECEGGSTVRSHRQSGVDVHKLFTPMDWFLHTFCCCLPHDTNSDYKYVTRSSKLKDKIDALREQRDIVDVLLGISKLEKDLESLQILVYDDILPTVSQMSSTFKDSGKEDGTKHMTSNFKFQSSLLYEELKRDRTDSFSEVVQTTKNVHKEHAKMIKNIVTKELSKQSPPHDLSCLQEELQSDNEEASGAPYNPKNSEWIERNSNQSSSKHNLANFHPLNQDEKDGNKHEQDPDLDESKQFILE